ncbi:hypothetical protein [Nitrospina watsonii]|uniref:hypothetical protein n=1 Tax=Nitrospina watsonii TaxID=1323948 RepID=UPI002490F378|nr:hypothetical protein [Nitrospina watsonii]
MLRAGALIFILAVTLAAPDDASAHRSGCHRWHSCPSDTGSYICGDTGHCSACPDNRFCESGRPRTGNKHEPPEYEPPPATNPKRQEPEKKPTPKKPEAVENIKDPGRVTRHP